MYYLREYTLFLLHCKTMKVAPLLNHSSKVETITAFSALLSLRIARGAFHFFAQASPAPSGLEGGRLRKVLRQE